jgi:hypothetical protein
MTAKVPPIMLMSRLRYVEIGFLCLSNKFTEPMINEIESIIIEIYPVA